MSVRNGGGGGNETPGRLWEAPAGLGVTLSGRVLLPQPQAMSREDELARSPWGSASLPSCPCSNKVNGCDFFSILF